MDVGDEYFKNTFEKVNEDIASNLDNIFSVVEPTEDFSEGEALKCFDQVPCSAVSAMEATSIVKEEIEICQTTLRYWDGKIKSENTVYYEAGNSEKVESCSNDNVKVIAIPKKVYSCYACEKSYPSLTSRRLHFGSHFGKHCIPCKFCGKMFVKKSDFLKHSDHFVKSCRKRVYVKIASKSFIQKPNKLNHSRIHKGQKPFKCKFCFKLFTRKPQLLRHLRIFKGQKHLKNASKHLKNATNREPLAPKVRSHRFTKKSQVTKQLFPCTTCSKEFRRKQNLVQHLKVHTRQKPFKCQLCSKQFTTKPILTTHLTIHTGEKPFKCDICSKRFRLKTILNDHLALHSGQNRFRKQLKCEICSKVLKSHLNEHLRTHSGEKPFKCEICSKQFSRKSHLTGHLLIHTGTFFHCDLCSKRFSRKRQLIIHSRIHTDQNPLKCAICFKNFTKKQDLNVHLNVHISGQIFECATCSKQFATKRSLKVHLNIHRGQKTFKCELCSKAFYRKGCLTRHLTSHTHKKKHLMKN